jgi:hypothetical protein
MRIGTSWRIGRQEVIADGGPVQVFPESVTVRIRLAAVATDRPQHPRLWNIIAASSVGTMIEWYDF